MTRSKMKELLAARAAEADRPLPKILFAAAECAPLAKTGGLADVVGTLPKYLCKLGFDARVILPYHRIIKEKYGAKVRYLFSFEVKMGWRTRFVGIHQLKLDGLCIWLVENEEYFSGPIYLPGRDCEQYGYFSRAVLEALERLDFIPDILHCNDWHTGLIPLLIQTQYQNRPIAHVKTLFTIHNIAYQGICDFLFTADWMGIPERYNPLMERYGCMASFMKAACVQADRVNTVSPNYAREITTPEFGEGLDGILSARGADLGGIVNGIDKNLWNPAKDKALPANFSIRDLSGKAVCKRELLKEFGLGPEAESKPLVGMVTRLAEQKGVQLLIDAAEDILQEDFCLLVLGNGDPGYEAWLREAEERWPGKIRAHIGYSDPLSHRIYAGCDFFLMPSRFEPCGISQMIAMRYGTLPIVRSTGGLTDTVTPYNRFTGEGDGFRFNRYDAADMAGILRYALQTYENKEAMAGLIRNAMQKDFGCDAWAFEYGNLYLDMLN